jgi:hypothetical protein
MHTSVKVVSENFHQNARKRIKSTSIANWILMPTLHTTAQQQSVHLAIEKKKKEKKRGEQKNTEAEECSSVPDFSWN